MLLLASFAGLALLLASKSSGARSSMLYMAQDQNAAGVSPIVGN